MVDRNRYADPVDYAGIVCSLVVLNGGDATAEAKIIDTAAAQEKEGITSRTVSDLEVAWKGCEQRLREMKAGRYLFIRADSPSD